jgi:hypothetical protein
MERKANILEKIGSLISGYSGYAERDGRRNCDKALRIEITNTLSEYEKGLVKLIPHLVAVNNFSALNELELIRKSINTLTFKIEFAPYGVSGFFDNDFIKEEELAQVYTMDLELMESVKSLSMSNYEEFKQLINCINKIEENLNRRNNYISRF